jgi:pimeloyl-ACP methyl ester carboxylesterase
MATLKTPDGHIYYEVHGSGYPVLLFAPGFLSSRIERWSSNPARPGVAQDWLDPIAALGSEFQLIALDVRNAGRSRATLGLADDWSSYTADHLALLDHLGVGRCHVMNACIGVSFALSLAQARPGLVSALVLQNPIGLSAENRAALDHESNAGQRKCGAGPTSTRSGSPRSRSECLAASSSSASRRNSCVPAKSPCCWCLATISFTPP